MCTLASTYNGTCSGGSAQLGTDRRGRGAHLRTRCIAFNCPELPPCPSAEICPHWPTLSQPAVYVQLGKVRLRPETGLFRLFDRVDPDVEVVLKLHRLGAGAGGGFRVHRELAGGGETPVFVSLRPSAPRRLISLPDAPYPYMYGTR